MNPVITAVCASCCTRVDARELQNTVKKCDVCRGVTWIPPEPLQIEGLRQGGLTLVDQRTFDGGAHLHLCDEV